MVVPAAGYSGQRDAYIIACCVVIMSSLMVLAGVSEMLLLWRDRAKNVTHLQITIVVAVSGFVACVAGLAIATHHGSIVHNKTLAMCFGLGGYTSFFPVVIYVQLFENETVRGWIVSLSASIVYVALWITVVLTADPDIPKNINVSYCLIISHSIFGPLFLC